MMASNVDERIKPWDILERTLGREINMNRGNFKGWKMVGDVLIFCSINSISYIVPLISKVPFPTAVPSTLEASQK